MKRNKDYRSCNPHDFNHVALKYGYIDFNKGFNETEKKQK